jgi:hypothetical protein
MTTVDLLQIAVTGALFSLIWLIQLLVYPSFKLVTDNFHACMLHHQNRISWIVIPFMISEIIITAIQKNVLLIGIVTLIWTSTAFIQVPLHKKLLNNSVEHIDTLIYSNWIRTFLWSIKLFIVLSTTIHTL